jgi:4'-phosphopantetheinyl transferase
MTITLNPSEMHLWFINDQEITDPSLLISYLTLLNEEEQAKQSRFYFEKDRHQYLITRAFLRIVLSFYEREIAPEQWQFQRQLHGKPFITNPVKKPLYFNLSHTAGKIVIALSYRDGMGVDIENINRESNLQEIAKTIFSSEEFEFFSHLDKQERLYYFFLLWTLKEAYVKAQGKSISMPMTELTYLKDKIYLQNRNPNWQFWSMFFEDNYQLSIAAPSLEKNRYNSIHMFQINSAKEWHCVDYDIKSIPINS